jgi:hypothetical protein
MARGESAATVRFRGSPERLTGSAPLPSGGPLNLDVRLDLPEELGGSAPVYAQPLAANIGALAWLRLSLPTSTPPGTYAGTIRLGERPYKVAVEVEPRLQLRFSPVGLVLLGAPGSAVSGGFTLFNTGNVAFEVRRLYAFGVFDVDGLDNAFGQTFRARLQPGERRIDRFAEALGEGHGGLVRARIVKGAGEVPPNSIREVGATFRLPDRMRSGRAYAGTLPLDYARYGVRIETTDPQREEEKPE